MAVETLQDSKLMWVSCFDCLSEINAQTILWKEFHNVLCHLSFALQLTLPYYTWNRWHFIQVIFFCSIQFDEKLEKLESSLCLWKWQKNKLLKPSSSTQTWTFGKGLLISRSPLSVHTMRRQRRVSSWKLHEVASNNLRLNNDLLKMTKRKEKKKD